jgi:hypothetical protein
MSKEKSINISRASQIETEILVHHKIRIRTNIQVSVTVSIKKPQKNVLIQVKQVPIIK